MLILSTILLSLLYFTKPHAIALILSFVLFVVLYALKSLYGKDFKGVKMSINTIAVLFITFILCIVLFSSLLHGELIYKFWELGVYSNIVAGQSNIQPSEFFNAAFIKNVYIWWMGTLTHGQ